MKKNVLLFISFIILISCHDDKSGMSLIFTGDVILDRGVSDEIKLHGDTILVDALKRIEKKDFFIINYEGTFTKSDLNQNDFFHFKADENKASLLNQGGVTHVSIANNHIYDFGNVGFEDTIAALTKNDLIPLGEICEPKILKKGKIKCAVLSASLTANNDSLCISTIEQLKNSIEVFEDENLSVPLILYLHWGLELQPKPENWQRELAEDLVKMGADAIIGHHPHIVQTIEFINETPVFYSIGNYIADAYLPYTDNSYIVELTVTDKIQDIKIKPIRIENYFPNLINHQEQLSYVKNFLSFSDGICALKLKDSWLIRPMQNVNFQENTNLWIFSADKTTTSVKRLQTGSHLLTLYTPTETSNTISLHGHLSEIQISDINNDGSTDIILGIGKKVHFDSTFKKRINIYSYQNQNLQPLWLGTKFIHDIESFDVFQSENFNYLATIEIDKKGNRFQGIYEWDNFGFALIRLDQIKANEN